MVDESDLSLIGRKCPLLYRRRHPIPLRERAAGIGELQCLCTYTRDRDGVGGHYTHLHGWRRPDKAGLRHLLCAVVIVIHHGFSGCIIT